MKPNFNASDIPANESKTYQNTTEVYQFDKTPLGHLLKPFLRPPWLKSSLVVVFVSPTLLQACCLSGAEGPLGSSASACLRTCLVPARSPGHLWPLANGGCCPLPTSMGAAGQHPSRWGRGPVRWLPLPAPRLPQGAAPAAAPPRLCPWPTRLNQSGQEAGF